MIYLFHGEDFVASRNEFNKARDKESVTIDAANLDKDLINQLLSESSLFSLHKNILVENFFNKKASKNTEALLNFLNNASHLDIYIWNDKEISKSQLDQFSKHEERNFKISKNIFGFVDSISPSSPANVKNFHDTLSYSSPEFIFTMIVRQFRLMIGLLDRSGKNIDEVNRLRDWQESKLRKQLSLFGNEKVINIYKKLNKIDKSQKTGATKLNLVQAIDMLLVEI